MDPDLELAEDFAPIVRQRLAAYTIALSSRGILATQFSDKTAVPGLWGLPGGGIDLGEAAAQAVIREVDEETGQVLEISHLLDLQTDHWIGRSPTGLIEDFHAVRIIFAGRCPEPTTPVVNDVGGTTSAAAWIPLSRWATTRWSASARALLERHLQPLADAWLAAG
ncbi:MAG: NUDIX domain-containing protein [Propionibacteriaceae bacterium]|nr:NUDIX domain-containing protein [Propionibacteriaceae bacterium]